MRPRPVPRPVALVAAAGLAVVTGALMLAVAACGSSQAVGYAASGFVIDANTTKGVGNATVTVSNANAVYHTAANGAFNLPLSGKAGDSANISVSAQGYSSALRPYTVGTSSGPLYIYLTPAAAADTSSNSPFGN